MILQERSKCNKADVNGKERELAQMTWRVRFISGCWATKGSLQCICRTWQSIISWYTFRFIFLQSRFPFNRLPLTFRASLILEEMQRPSNVDIRRAFYLNCILVLVLYVEMMESKPSCSLQCEFLYFDW